MSTVVAYFVKVKRHTKEKERPFRGLCVCVFSLFLSFVCADSFFVHVLEVGRRAAMEALDAKTRGSVLRQLEYYFSDVSLPYDDFLLGLVLVVAVEGLLDLSSDNTLRF